MANGSAPNNTKFTRQELSFGGTNAPSAAIADSWFFDSATVTNPTVWTAKQDAQYSFSVDSWNTPFTPLESDVASDGLVLDVREPHSSYAWSGTTSFVADVKAASAGTLNSVFTNSTKSTQVISSGRTANLIEFWSAGAPLWYGASQRGRVALHYQGALRPVIGRSWFSATSEITITLAFAGNGYVRCTKTRLGASITAEVQIGGTNGYTLTEAEWLEQGYKFSEPITLNPGDVLDIYYVQNQESWGGLVAKVVLGPVSGYTTAQQNALAAAAPVLGCGLFDDGSQPTKQSWKHIISGNIEVEQSHTPQATITVPLLNPDIHDGFGWEWKKDSDIDPGYLTLWDGGIAQFTVRRGRLIRIKTGYIGNESVVFTGIIQDIPVPQQGMAQVRCIGLEYRLLESRNKLEPDFVSYMAAGYRTLTGALDPVYGVTAYDAWTIESALGDMAIRAGIDESHLRQPLTIRNINGNVIPVTFEGEAFTKFRARTLNGSKVRLERPIHYGNVGTQFTENKPIDDKYLFTPELRDDAWARVLEIADRYGYDIRFDVSGDFVLSSRANPCRAYDITAADSVQASTRKTHPSAYKGTYIEWTNVPTVTKTVTGVRIDVSLPRGPGLSPWSYIRVVRQSDNVEMTRVNNVDVTATTNVYYYDYRFSDDGTNATLLTGGNVSYTLFSGAFDTYTVEFVASGSGTRRLDTIFTYHTDPLAPKYALSEAENALEVTAGDASDEMRNMVIVVGARKATTTDSEKFQTNPNNADPEFIVEAAVDEKSITDPTAENYVGMRRESLVIDSKVSDQDYAAYLARTFIYRYRSPKAPVTILHTLLPDVQLRQPLTATETAFNTVQPASTLWIVGYSHRFDVQGEFITQINTSPWPEYPSYEPRQDIDIDTDFNGVPVANVEVTYTSCTGHTKTNLAGSGVVVESKDSVDIVSVPAISVTGGSPPYLDMGATNQPWPPIPGTVAIRAAAGLSSLVTEEYAPHSLGLGSTIAEPRPQKIGGDPYLYIMSKNSVVNIPLTGGVAANGIVSVDAVLWTIGYGGNTSACLHWGSLGVSSAYDPTKAWVWTFNEDENVLTIKMVQDLLAVIEGFNTDGALQVMGYSFRVVYNKLATRDASAWKKNTPYHHFMNVDYRDTNRKIFLPWNQGDDTSAYNRPAANTAYDVMWRKLGAVTGTGAYSASYGSGSPFFDVTTSELGYLVRLTFDALVSGLYRISVRSAYDHTTVAYLTEPTADAAQPESHWSFLTAGAARSFNWDGVDQLGTWNRKQSEEYAAYSQGWFEDEEKQAIGAGWYVWNRERVNGGYAPLALISDDRDTNTGIPIYGQGTYAAWYFHIECKNETLASLAETNGTAYPRIVRTIEADTNEAAPTYTTGAKAGVVYTHAPKPAQLELEVADWIETFDYDATNSTHTNDSHWSAPWYDSDVTTPQTYEALLSNQKPVRLRFRVVPRTGVLWTNNSGEAQVKLTRHVHLRACIFDQFAVGEGGNWPNTGVEQRTVYSRRLMNDDHTITFVDQGWRKASTLKNSANSTGVTEWIFRPSDFKKNFRGIENEPIEFGDYLQLEEVPKWEQQRSAAGQHSRFICAFMSYLFYLSGYCIDRTGRRTWAINRSFVDRSKITFNTYSHWWNPTSPTTAATATTYKAELPEDPQFQQRRSVVCRQWVNESGWQTAQQSKWGFAAGTSIGDKLLKHKWEDHEPGSANLVGASWPSLDVDQHSRWHRDGRTDLPSSFGSTPTWMPRQLGTSGTSQLNNWTWESDPLWIPCITRDFHPFYLVPPQADAQDEATLRSSYQYAIVDVSTYSSGANTGQDVARYATWSSWARDMTRAYSSGKVRFEVGTRTEPTKNTAAGGVEADSLDYVRQNDCVHFEDLRGLYSRGPRPAEQVKKLAPGRPYFINLYSYSSVNPRRGDGKWHKGDPATRQFPNYAVLVSAWFRMGFRSEYLWESSTFFPVDYQGRESLGYVNMRIARFAGTKFLTASEPVAYDGGAWVGWKDDTSTTLVADSAGGSAFATGWPTFAVGRKIAPTTEMYMHLVLVNERRNVPLP